MSFCLLVKVVGHREQPPSTCSPATRKILLGDNCPQSLPKETRPGVLKLVCRAAGQHGICSPQNGMHSGVWRESVFGSEGFVYARSLAGWRQMEVILRDRSQLTVASWFWTTMGEPVLGGSFYPNPCHLVVVLCPKNEVFCSLTVCPWCF